MSITPEQDDVSIKSQRYFAFSSIDLPRITYLIDPCYPGDSLPYPATSKELLDKELDEMFLERYWQVGMWKDKINNETEKELINGFEWPAGICLQFKIFVENLENLQAEV